MAVQNPKITGFWIRFHVFGVVEAGNRYKPVQEKPDFMPFWKDEAWEVVLQLIEVVYFNYRVLIAVFMWGYAEDKFVLNRVFAKGHELLRIYACEGNEI